MIDNVLKNYRYVREYDTSAKISESLIHSLLQRTWKVTPSKNNFMPYRVLVIGPDEQSLKDDVFNLCLRNECRADGETNFEEFFQRRYVDRGIVPQFHNIKSCSYLILFNQRVETELNPWQQYSVNDGRVYEQTSKDNAWRCFKNSCIEVGMFASTFAALCIESGLDVSHTLCFPTEPKYWEEFWGKFNIDDPSAILAMTVGKGSVYRQDVLEELEKTDLKPDFHKVVQFLKNER